MILSVLHYCTRLAATLTEVSHPHSHWASGSGMFDCEARWRRNDVIKDTTILIQISIQPSDASDLFNWTLNLRHNVCLCRGKSFTSPRASCWLIATHELNVLWIKSWSAMIHLHQETSVWFMFLFSSRRYVIDNGDGSSVTKTFFKRIFIYLWVSVCKFISSVVN